MWLPVTEHYYSTSTSLKKRKAHNDLEQREDQIRTQTELLMTPTFNEATSFKVSRLKTSHWIHKREAFQYWFSAVLSMTPG